MVFDIHEMEDVGKFVLDDLVVLLLDEILPADDGVVPLQRLLLLLRLLREHWQLLPVSRLQPFTQVVVKADLVQPSRGRLLRRVLIRCWLVPQLLLHITYIIVCENRVAFIFEFLIGLFLLTLLALVMVVGVLLHELRKLIGLLLTLFVEGY